MTTDPQEAVHNLLQRLGPPDVERPAVLVAWTVVAEWMDDEGGRWLSRGHAPSMSAWHADGLHHEALYGDWLDEEDDE